MRVAPAENLIFHLLGHLWAVRIELLYFLLHLIMVLGDVADEGIDEVDMLVEALDDRFEVGCGPCAAIRLVIRVFL